MTAPTPPREQCPGCLAKVQRLPNGELAHHYNQGPGVGLQCTGKAPT